jgi:hypothetical protein
VLSAASSGTATVYYGSDCTHPYLVANLTGSLGTSGGYEINISETDTYYGLNGTSIGTLTLNETALDSGAVTVYGLGIFTPASGAQTPVELGLYCKFASTTATGAQCAETIAQNFPALGLAIGAVTPLTLTLSGPTSLLQLGGAPPGAVTFTGGGTAVSGPIGSLTLTTRNRRRSLSRAVPPMPPPLPTAARPRSRCFPRRRLRGCSPIRPTISNCRSPWPAIRPTT